VHQSVVWVSLKIVDRILSPLAFWTMFFTSLEMLGKLSILFNMLTEN